jgi:superkiller protein 3
MRPKRRLNRIIFHWLIAAAQRLLRGVTLARAAIAVFVLPLSFYTYKEVTRDVLVVDPITVPKQLEDAGLTPVVMADRVGDRMARIEIDTRTIMRKDKLTSVDNQEPTPDFEIPGTNLGLRTVIGTMRSIFGIYPKHISGDIVLPVRIGSQSGGASDKATVTICVIQARNRSQPTSVAVPANDPDALIEGTAEIALEQINPYILASNLEDRGEYERGIDVVKRLVQDPNQDSFHKEASFNLWGVLLIDENKYDDAIDKLQTAILLDPNDALPYINWGIALSDEGKHDEAIVKYRKGIQLDPKCELCFDNWGEELLDEEKYEGAIVEYREATRLDPNAADPYIGLGYALGKLGRFSEGIAMDQKAINLDPNDPEPFTNWGDALEEQGEYDQAIAQYRKAIESDPQDVDAYSGWGAVLLDQRRYAEAVVKFHAALKIDRSDLGARQGWNRARSMIAASTKNTEPSTKTAEQSTKNTESEGGRGCSHDGPGKQRPKHKGQKFARKPCQ